MNEKELLNRIAELPREVRPEHDQWERIAARLDENTSGLGDPAATGRPAYRLHGWLPRAVAAMAVVAVAVVLMSGPEPVTQQATHSQAVSQVSTPSMVVPVVLAGSEAEYQAAFREFIAIGDSRNQIPLSTVEKIETGWADLLQVETALSDALAQNPNDPFLNKRMLELRARQLGFLRQLASLDHSNRRLTI